MAATTIDMGHPWARSPASIGSIATMYLSILFMRDIKEGEDGFQQQELQINKHYETILKKNICQVFNKNLHHKVTLFHLGPRQSLNHHSSTRLSRRIPTN